MAPSGESSQQKRETQCTELYAALRERGVHCLSFFAANFSGAAKTRDLRNYEGAVGRQSSAACVQRASTGIKTSGASEFRKGRPQRASEPNTKPGGVRVVCALRFFVHERDTRKRSPVGPPELARCASLFSSCFCRFDIHLRIRDKYSATNVQKPRQ